jgi:hypothetical protein
MTRILVAVLLLTASAGVAVGWIASTWPSAEIAATCPCSSSNCEVAETVHRFTLLPADLNVSGEKPAVAINVDGRVLVAWASETAVNERTLFLAASTNGGTTFETPVPFRKVRVARLKTQMKGKEVVRSSHVQPRLAVGGTTLFLAWTEATEQGDVEYLVARSEDGGKTFADPIKAHGALAKRPGYTGLGAGANGSVAGVWLESRNGRQQPFAAMAGPGVAFGEEKLVYSGPQDKGICPCCEIEVACAPDGTAFVAFRNNDSDIRDICISRLPVGATTFDPPMPVSAHHWKFPGCPHDGPALAFDAGRLYVAWMDAHAGAQRVYVGHSGIEKLAFTSQPLDPDAPGQQGHPRLAAANGLLHAVWDGSLADEPAEPKAEGHHHHGPPQGGSGRAVMYAAWPSTSDRPGATRALAPVPGAFQLNPAVAVGPLGVTVVVWSETTETGKSIACLRVATPK